MTASAACRALIESFESCRLKAYQDGRGVWTLGTGHTKGVCEGDICTFQQANDWLSEDLQEAESAVNRLVTVPLTQNQFDALVSLVFNIGQGNFEGSTVLRRLNQKSYGAAADAFLMWTKIGGQISAGLVRRREAERKLFSGGA